MKLKDTPWKKIHDQPRQHIKNERPLSTKVHLVKALVFPVVMYGCESWTVKKADHERIDAFELWWWRRLLWVPWTAGISKQSILKEISPEYSLEGLMLQLKLKLLQFITWYEELTLWKKTLVLGKIEGKRKRGGRGWDGWMASPTQWTWVWASSGSWWWTGKPGMLQSMGLQRVGLEWVTEQQQQQLLIGLPPWFLVLQYLVEEGVVTQIEHPSP